MIVPPPGIVGASDSDASIDVSNFAENFNIPVVSFMATAPELSSAQRYPTFMRTIPPDGPLMDVSREKLGIRSSLGTINMNKLVIVLTLRYPFSMQFF